MHHILQSRCRQFFQPWIHQSFALVYIDDIFLLSNHKLPMLELIQELHTISTKNNVEPAFTKNHFVCYKKLNSLDTKLEIIQ